jgi:hypothetical protein
VVCNYSSFLMSEEIKFYLFTFLFFILHLEMEIQPHLLSEFLQEIGCWEESWEAETQPPASAVLPLLFTAQPSLPLLCNFSKCVLPSISSTPPASSQNTVILFQSLVRHPPHFISSLSFPLLHTKMHLSLIIHIFLICKLTCSWKWI